MGKKKLEGIAAKRVEALAAAIRDDDEPLALQRFHNACKMVGRDVVFNHLPDEVLGRLRQLLHDQLKGTGKLQPVSE